MIKGFTDKPFKPVEKNGIVVGSINKNGFFMNNAGKPLMPRIGTETHRSIYTPVICGKCYSIRIESTVKRLFGNKITANELWKSVCDSFVEKELEKKPKEEKQTGKSNFERSKEIRKEILQKMIDDRFATPEDIANELNMSRSVVQNHYDAICDESAGHIVYKKTLCAGWIDSEGKHHKCKHKTKTYDYRCSACRTLHGGGVNAYESDDFGCGICL